MMQRALPSRAARWPGIVALAAVLLLGAGCDRRRDEGAVIVSAIGSAPQLADPSRGGQSEASRLFMAATAQGLVRFDATGQIEPGIAERWIVIDDGTSYIFRLRDAEWPDGKPVTSADVVAVLRRQIAAESRNPLRPFLSAIGEIVEMTPEVIEVRLRRPRPDLLKLFAQPELAIFRTRPHGGSGPFRMSGRTPRSVMLRPAFDPSRSPDDEPTEPSPEQEVRLIGERAARAIARFAARESDLVAGGSFLDWPLLATTDITPQNLKIDPAAGLFGLAIVDRGGFLADPANRAAVGSALDRDAISQAFGGNWATTKQLLPEQLDSAAAPSVPAWATLSRAAQLAGAAQRVAAWQAAHRQPSLRVALPAGPGANLLFGLIGANLRAIGIEPVRVPHDAPADLQLIDAVAPYDSGRWYLATACVLCGDEAQTALLAARDAPTALLRSRHIAEADAALAADTAFIPIARPLRWSLVAVRLRAWTGNSRAWHPLNHLRNDTN